jgi:hypothetical protein
MIYFLKLKMDLEEIKKIQIELKTLIQEVREENRATYLSLVEQQKQNTEFSQSLCRMLKATRMEKDFKSLIVKAGETIALANSQSSVKPNGEIKPENKDILPENEIVKKDETVNSEIVKKDETVERISETIDEPTVDGRQTLKNFFEELWKNDGVLIVHAGSNLTAKQLCPASLKNKISQEGEKDIFKMLTELSDPSAKKYMQLLENKYQELIK